MTSPIHEVTAQQLYKTMIDGMISTRLRKLGMKGSGGRYELPSITHWAMLGFQKSAYSDRAEVRFTINLFVVSHVDWDLEVATHSFQAKKPTAASSANGIPSKRIGKLGVGRDYWWILNGETNLHSLSDEVLAEIEAHGLPWLKNQIPEGAA